MKREGGQTCSLVCALCLCAAVACFVRAFPTRAFGQVPQQSVPTSDTSSETINVDLSAPEHPFPHFWEQMFGSGRAILSLARQLSPGLAGSQAGHGFRIHSLSRNFS